MKKWTYLVAAGMLLGATPVFTGCIDNDEPAGITELRGAKAELIRAKKVIAEAEAERQKAEAEYLKAQAEVQKAMAEVERARAEKILAEARAAEAESEAEILKIQAEIAKLEAEMQAAQEAAAKNLEILEQKLQEQIAITEAAKKQAALDMATAHWEVIEPIYNAWTAAIDAYNEKLAIVIEKQNALADAQADMDAWKPGTTDLRELEWTLKTEEAYLEALKAQEEGIDAEIEAAKAMKPAALPARRDEVQKEIDALEAEIAQRNLEMAEAKLADADGLYAALEAAQKAADESGDVEVPIAEFKNTISATYWRPAEGEDAVVVAESNFTASNDDNYWDAIQLLNNFKNEARYYQLDENDQKWTEAKINEFEPLIEAATEELAAAEKLFNQAVKGYNEGKGQDVTAYDGYTDMVAGAEAVNAAAQALKDARAEMKPLTEAADAAYKAFADANNEDPTGAWKIYSDKIEELEANFENLKLENEKVIENINKEFSGQYEKDWADLQILLAKAELAGVKLAQNPTDEELQKAKEDADKAVTESQTALDTAYEEFVAKLEAEEKKQASALEVAQAQMNVDKKEAYKVYVITNQEWGGDIDPAHFANIEALYAAFETAQQAVNDAYDKTVELKENFMTAASDFNAIDFDAKEYFYLDFWNFAQGYTDEFEEVVVDGTYFREAKEYLLEKSRFAYGMSIKPDEEYDGTNWPVERILPMTKEDIDALIDQYYGSNYSEFARKYVYRDCFGALGKSLYVKAEQDICKEYLAKADEFDQLIKDIDAAIAKLGADKKANDDAIKALEEAAKEAKLAVDEFEFAFDEKNILAEAEISLLRDVLDQVNKVLATVEDGDPAKISQADIDGLVGQLKAIKEALPAAIYAQETVVLAAQEEVENAKETPEETVSAVTMAQRALDAAQVVADQYKAKMERAEQNYKDALSAVEEAVK